MRESGKVSKSVYQRKWKWVNEYENEIREEKRNRKRKDKKSHRTKRIIAIDKKQV